MGLLDSLITPQSQLPQGLLSAQDLDSARTQSLMALAAGLMKGDFAGGLLAASKGFSDAQESAVKNKLVQAQLQNYASEIETRKAALAKQTQLQKLLGDAFGGVESPASAPAVPALPGQLGSGSLGVVPPPAGQPLIPSMPPAPVPAPAGSRIGRMSPDTLALLKANGLDLVDVAKLGRPDWRVDGGIRWNANDPSNADGPMPFVRATENGPTLVGVRDASVPGGIRVMPAAGSLETTTAFLQAQEGVKDRYARPNVVEFSPTDKRGLLPWQERAAANGGVDPATGQTLPGYGGAPAVAPLGAPRAPVVGPRPGFVPGEPGSAPGIRIPAADQAARDGQALQILQAELGKPQYNEDERASIRREIARLQGRPAAAVPDGPVAVAGAVPAAGPGMKVQNADEAATAEASKTYKVEGAKNFAEQQKAIQNAGFQAPQNISRYQQIGRLLENVYGGKWTPAGTEFASALNSVGIQIDKNLGNKQAAEALANQAALELRNPSGGAGMPGALSDGDRKFLSAMTPNMMQSAEGRKQIIDAYVALQQRNQKVAEFARKYEQKHGRLDNGFFDALSIWSNQNPLIGGR